MSLLDKIDHLLNEERFVDDHQEQVMIGGNTWLFIEHPLLEEIIYPITDILSDDEIDHFQLLVEITREEKARRKELFKAAKQKGPSSGHDAKVEKAFKDITKKSRLAFHDLDALGKKSFIAKYILHGLEKTSKEATWGRVDRTSKEMYSDSLQSFKEKQRFVNDIFKMYKGWQAQNKEGLARLTKEMQRFKSLVDLEASIGRSTDSFVTKLFEYTKDKFGKGWFSEGAYLEFLFKIRTKQYNSLSELQTCIKQWNAIQGNTKTTLTVDMSTVCPKRKVLLGMMKDWSLAQKQLADAIEAGAEKGMLKKLEQREKQMRVTEGNNPVCAYCYVESARAIADKNPKYFLAKAEKEGLRYQDTFKGWIKKSKGEWVRDEDGNVMLSKVGKKNVELFNRMGGLRFFSSGDYIEDQATDKEIERIITDAEIVGLQLKAITKTEKFVRKYGGRLFQKGPLKGRPIFNINMSVDEQKGFKLEIAKHYKKLFPGNVNIRVVAFNPKQAAVYAKDSAVDVVTLLHFGARGRMTNKDLFVNMSPGSKGWDMAIDAMKEDIPKADVNKILSKLCCATSKCETCPNACGFNPRRVADYTQLAKGGKKVLKIAA